MTERSGAGPRPLVGIVVVNFHGDDRTLACLDALAASTWPTDRLIVVVVDNGSSPGFADRVAARPGVRHLDAAGNVGFPAACNLGIDALVDTCDIVGLVNNDATPEPGWLEPLVAELERDERVGGVTPRLVLAGRFVRMRFRVATRAAGGGDTRDLGVQLSGVRVAGRDLTGAVELGAGFWGWEEGRPAGRFAWTAGEATALVRLEDNAGETELCVEVRLSSVLGPVAADVDAGTGSRRIDVGEQPAWEVVAEDARAVRLVNSTGIEVHDDGSCGDRDYFALESEVPDREREVFACSGAAVLFRTAFLRDVGPMDERFFLYYEDVDLCWRGRLRGWRFRYVPEAVVVHEHSATVGSGSPLAAHLADRNRLLTLTKVAPRPVATGAVATALANLRRAGWNDVARPAIRGRRPETVHAVRTARVLLGYARLAPHALRQRRVLGRRATVDRRRAMTLS